jgi:hypothetical protein
MVLKYRYIHNYTWEQIGIELCADARTIRRWHGKALQHASLPEHPSSYEMRPKCPALSKDVHPPL